jgi:hypothetical protein
VKEIIEARVAIGLGLRGFLEFDGVVRQETRE